MKFQKIPIVLKSGKVMKEKDRMGNCHRLEVTKVNVKIKAMWYPGLELEQKKNIGRKAEKNLPLRCKTSSALGQSSSTPKGLV